MSKEARDKIAPLDSSQWKCNWIDCVGGCGLSGNGCCSEHGEWDNIDCPYFIKRPMEMLVVNVGIIKSELCTFKGIATLWQRCPACHTLYKINITNSSEDRTISPIVDISYEWRKPE